MDKDSKLIWESFLPSIGSHEKGKAIEVIQLYTAMIESEQELSRDIFLDTLKEKWKEVMDDPKTDDDHVLRHLMDQSDALPAGAGPVIFSAYRLALIA